MEYQVHCFHRTGGVCQAGVDLTKFIVLNVIYENISCAKLRFKEGNRPINNQPGIFFFLFIITLYTNHYHTKCIEI